MTLAVCRMIHPDVVAGERNGKRFTAPDDRLRDLIQWSQQLTTDLQHLIQKAEGAWLAGERAELEAEEEAFLEQRTAFYDAVKNTFRNYVSPKRYFDEILLVANQSGFRPFNCSVTYGVRTAANGFDSLLNFEGPNHISWTCKRLSSVFQEVNDRIDSISDLLRETSGAMETRELISRWEKVKALGRSICFYESNLHSMLAWAKAIKEHGLDISAHYTVKIEPSKIQWDYKNIFRKINALINQGSMLYERLTDQLKEARQSILSPNSREKEEEKIRFNRDFAAFIQSLPEAYDGCKLPLDQAALIREFFKNHPEYELYRIDLNFRVIEEEAKSLASLNFSNDTASSWSPSVSKNWLNEHQKKWQVIWNSVGKINELADLKNRIIALDSAELAVQSFFTAWTPMSHLHETRKLLQSVFHKGMNLNVLYQFRER